jgi:hypothetical protein
MKTLTWFRAYQHARNKMEAARSARGFTRGISADTDYWAKQYQHGERQSRKFAYRVAEALGEQRANYCTRCGWPKHCCPCKSGFHPRSRILDVVST